MKNRWSDSDAQGFVREHARLFGEDVALRIYSSRLLGQEPDLVMHGGGNTSLKTSYTNPVGEDIDALMVKGSGVDLGGAELDDFVVLDLEYLRKLETLTSLPDEAMAEEFETHRFQTGPRRASIETLLHAFVEEESVDHTHPSAVLALTNRDDGGELLPKVFGEDVAIIPYVEVGFELAKAVYGAYAGDERCRGVVIMHHGLVTWGQSAKESYDATVEIVTRAEQYLSGNRNREIGVERPTSQGAAGSRYRSIAPLLRGLLAPESGDPDIPHERGVLLPLTDRDTLELVDSAEGRDILVTAPVTPDYLIRTRMYPLWVDSPDYQDLDKLRLKVQEALAVYAKEYLEFLSRHGSGESSVSDLLPRVVLLPGMGAVCVGKTPSDAEMVRDITAQGLAVKRAVFETGGQYQGLSEEHLHNMECRSYQRAKLDSGGKGTLAGAIALVTGAAGAIGSGICRKLLEEGCCVAVTDLPGENLEAAVGQFAPTFGDRVVGIAMDVADEESVSSAYDSVVEQWGGVDLVVVNAGIAHVSSLAEMKVEDFRNLERVNVDGTLLTIRESASLFSLQGIGGDIVVISTKNVFAPGAQFGAYSATKAASHQLARIASLELAPMGVRVNMVSPDAVFSHGTTKSGLWATVGPDRMKARGLDEKGLEEYYRDRNLLKARVTAEHVARAVLYFATRQTPTTGATIPVDGGLPDATPR